MSKTPNVSTAFQGRKLPVQGEEFSEDTETKVVHIRLHKERAELLKKLFKLRGMDMTTGIRSILYDWLYRNMR